MVGRARLESEKKMKSRIVAMIAFAICVFCLSCTADDAAIANKYLEVEGSQLRVVTVTPESTSTVVVSPTVIPSPTAVSTVAESLGNWELLTYTQQVTGEELQAAYLKPIDSNPADISFFVACRRGSVLSSSIYWGDSTYILGTHNKPRKSPVQYFLDGVRKENYWILSEDRHSTIVPIVDLDAFVTQLSNAIVVGFEVYDYNDLTSREAFARFEVTGIDAVISQLPCAIPDEYVVLGKAKSSLARLETHNSSGSGVVVRSLNGYSDVITSWHVIEEYCELGGECVGVNLQHDGITYHASLVAFNSVEDIALLRVESELPAINIASDIPLRQESVIAIGYPGGAFDFQHNNGIVVGFTGCAFESCIRTNARTWKGFSGGALINESGELIGIVAEKFTGSSYSNAVSMDAVKKLMK